MNAVALVGNPNCGKTTLFNALTNSCQRIGNWAGVTVERKSGKFQSENTSVEVVDLPGIYSLSSVSQEISLDEKIAYDYIQQGNAHLIINVIDASNLQRNLYLTLQLLEMQIPIIVVVNMMDVAQKKGLCIDLKKLEKKLGCPVFAFASDHCKKINELKKIIVTNKINSPRIFPHQDKLFEQAAIKEAVEKILPTTHSIYWVLRSLEDSSCEEMNTWRQQIHSSTDEDADTLIANARYSFIDDVFSECVTSVVNKFHWTECIDRFVLNRWLGIPIFLAVMYGMFFCAIKVGGVFQNFFDTNSRILFVDGLSHMLMQWHVSPWLIALLANGMGKGINTVMTFIPVLGIMYLCLALLEDSGYMARAAFVMDRLMRVMGLPGKAFVPMIIGFGCNVPSVMAARTLENQRDRVLAVMMSPFMSCSARLTIYAVFAAAFFPSNGQNIIFTLYVTGVVMAILTGFVLRKTVLPNEISPLVMELPPFHAPHLNTLALLAWQRLQGFVIRAGKLIIPVCMFLGLLNTLNVDGTINQGEGGAHSILSVIGQWLTPFFSPMGIHSENWPATVGLLTGVLAKEVVVGTLNTLYAQMGNISQQFDRQAGVFAYLLFVSLYFPCVSTTAAMLREVGRSWAVFSMVWTTGIAYLVATLFYQVATYVYHPLVSSIWIISIITVLAIGLLSIRFHVNKKNNESVYELA